MKTCKKCYLVKPDKEFSKEKRNIDGLKGICKHCFNQYQQEWRLANPDKIKEYNTIWYAENKDKVKKSTKKWANSNSDKVVIYAKNRRENYASKISEYSKKWHRDNPIKSKEIKKRWKSKNLDKFTAYSANRRSARLLAVPHWVDLEEIKNFYSLAKILSRGGVKFEVDHIVPLKSNIVCGLHVSDNLQVLPSHQNQSKGNRYWPNMP